MLLCPVRGCALPLVRERSRVICERGHSFDIARSGYLNLLQPQDRRSRQPGDTPEAVQARRRIHDLGVTEPLMDSIAEMLNAVEGEDILDAGCGDGFYLGSIAKRTAVDAHGVDISVPAIEAAAKRYKSAEWIVANADRFLPYANASQDAVISITGRRNPAEFRRVLKAGGRLLVAVPAPDDLTELRGPEARDRTASTVAEFEGRFSPVTQQRATSTGILERSAVADLLKSIYRPSQRLPPPETKVTFSLDLLLFR